MRLPLIVLLIAALISAMILTSATRHNSGESSVFSSIERDFNKAKRRYNEALRDKALYKQYVNSYQKYSRKGIIGEEQRLSWIEQLQQINKYLKLPSLRYEISPQEPADISGMKIPKSVKINTSKMQLAAGLLHEGDLIALLRALKNNANGFYALNSCELVSRLSPDEAARYRPSAAYVNIDCSMDWYTVEIKS